MQVAVNPNIYARLKTGHSLNVPEEELDKSRYAYLMEKYQ